MSATAENATRRCPVCNTEYPATKKFCRLDGAVLVDAPARPVVVDPGGSIPAVASVAPVLPGDDSTVARVGASISPEGLRASPVPALAAPETVLASPAPSPGNPAITPAVRPEPSVGASVSSPERTIPIVKISAAAVKAAPPAAVVTERATVAAAAPSSPVAPSVVNVGSRRNTLKPVLVGAGVGLLLLALIGGGSYWMRQRRETVSPVMSPAKSRLDIIRDEGSINPAKSPAELEGQINRALRDAGLKEVFSAVDDRFGVMLKGTVPSEALKAKALAATKSFPQVAQVKDMIFVVE